MYVASPESYLHKYEHNLILRQRLLVGRLLLYHITEVTAARMLHHDVKTSILIMDTLSQSA